MLSKNVSPEGKIAANTTVKYCPRHSTTAISLVCTTCESLHCELCRPQHAGHNLQKIQNNGKLVKTVCRSQTQEFYSVLGVLEKEKDYRADLAVFYVEAKTKVRDEIKQLITKAMDIQSKIETELDEAYNLAKKKEDKVDEDVRRVDDCISQLHDVRNVRDVNVLVPKAVDNAVILAKFQHLKHKIYSKSSFLPSMENMFPNINKLNDLMKEFGIVFQMVIERGDRNFDEVIEYDYSKAKTIDTITIPNPTTKTYKICDADITETNEVAFHGHGKKDIVRYNVTAKTCTRQEYDFDIWSCVRTSPQSYVGRENINNAVHLMDQNGRRLDTLVTKGGTDCALCFHSPHKFVKLNRDDDNPCQVALSVINVSSGKCVVELEVKVTTKDKPDFMCKHRDKDLVSLVSDTSLYTVNLVTSAVDEDTIVNLVSHNIVCCFYVDSNDNKLVGVTGGTIHLFDSQMNHTVLTKVEGTPWGITVRGDKMFVAAKGKIYIYDIPKK